MNYSFPRDKMFHIRSNFKNIVISFWRLCTGPHFIILTIFGNLIVFLFAACFYLIEYGTNPLIDEKMDAIWWAFTTVTTVGFGDIVPTTFLGRILGIFLMLIGTALFACYVALISDFYLTIELKKVVKKKKF